ncbi:hypothetical protein HY639_00105 [Candidatus Woesearchaeota archaeon]|nr:hypothetical protein [Candidatus Woesearchaeota archaeon]
MRRLLRKPYLLWVCGLFVIYLGLTLYVSQFYVTVQYLPYYVRTIHWPTFILSIFVTLTIALLVAGNIVYAYLIYHEQKAIKKEATLTCASTFAGMTTGVCPACVPGFFPWLLSLLGTTWALLPLKGLEVQFLIIMVLTVSLYRLQKG